MNSADSNTKRAKSDIKIALVVGVAQNGVIGAEGGMPWRLSTDLKRFKTITMGKPMIMGRKTYQSIGKPLPGRLNVVVSRSGYDLAGYNSEEIKAASSLTNALDIAGEWARANGADEICIIGGGEIYRQSLAMADRLYVTHILAEPDGDTRFPSIDENNWRILSRQRIAKGEKDTAETIFVIYERILPPSAL